MDINWRCNQFQILCTRWRNIIIFYCFFDVMTIVCFLFSEWHRRLNHKANNSCPPFYLLAKLLHDEAVTAVRNAELVSDMKLRRYQRARYATLQGRLSPCGRATERATSPPLVCWRRSAACTSHLWVSQTPSSNWTMCWSVWTI